MRMRILLSLEVLLEKCLTVITELTPLRIENSGIFLLKKNRTFYWNESKLEFIDWKNIILGKADAHCLVLKHIQGLWTSKIMKNFCRHLDNIELPVEGKFILVLVLLVALSSARTLYRNRYQVLRERKYDSLI